MKNRLLYSLLIALVPLLVTGQSIPEDRRIDWSKAGLEPGRPEFKKKINMISQGADNSGKKDNTLVLNKVLNKTDGKPTIVYFPEGTYRFDYVIRVPSNIVIKGDGSEKTKFVFTPGEVGHKGVFHIANYDFLSETPVESGYEKGSTTITLSNAAAFNVGDDIDISQEDDAEIMYTKEKWEQGWAKGAMGQLLQVIEKNGNTLTVYPPLRMTFKASLNPVVKKFTPIENVGFEDFTIENTKEGDKMTFYFKGAANCWFKGVHSYKTSKYHIGIEMSRNFYITNCMIEDAFRHDGGGHGYGVLCGKHTRDCLIENNIFKRLRHSMIVKEGANGNVYAYNFSCCGTWDHLPQIPADISIHGHYSYMNLFESNIVEHINSADFWGPSGPGTTFFRNKVTIDNIDVRDHSIDQNIVGNVIEKGKFYIEPSVTGTLLNGNVVNNKVSWESDATNQQALINSYYLDKKPEFFGDMPWPCIGPDVSNDLKLPAQVRYESKKYIIQP